MHRKALTMLHQQVYSLSLMSFHSRFALTLRTHADWQKKKTTDWIGTLRPCRTSTNSAYPI